MKCVFLDFDGVLNSMPHLYAIEKTNKDKPYELWIDEQIDPVAVERLNTLLERSGAHVVISSTWRRIHHIDELRSMLTRRGFKYKDRVIGTTPTRWRDQEGVRQYRGDEIQEWLSGHPEVTAFVILDDESDMVHLVPKLVQTDSQIGLMDEHVEAAIVMLGGDE